MKKLSIEEKAKRYDVAFERAKEMIKAMTNIGGVAKVDDIQYLFPELKESEDERIRKWIIAYLENRVMNTSITDEKDNCLNAIRWLEKQGEHAKFCGSIQVGDKVTKNQDGVLVNLSQLNRVAKKDEKQCEQKPATMSLDEAIEHYKKKSCGNSECALEHKQLEKWLTELKELKEQKPTWSQEDEDILNTIINHFKVDIECTDEDDTVRWLKSLRPQNKWKPSDEQMEALEYYMHTLTCNEHKEILFGLYTDLKKLREK